MTPTEDLPAFQQALLSWFKGVARPMPWRENNAAYRVWVSEIMLQQTQVSTVIPYFERFMQAFPSVQALATAPQEKVLKYWEGLGYYSRARNLHKGAQYVFEHCAGRVPDQPDAIRKVPGIGPYSAGAILSIAYGLPEPAVDGNVLRVFSRLLALDKAVDKSSTLRELTETVRACIPHEQPGDFNQALMELGALVCKPRQPLCSNCPLQPFCQAAAAGEPEKYPHKAKKTKVKTLQLLVLLLQNPAGEFLFQHQHAQQGQQNIFRDLWCLPWLSLPADSSPGPDTASWLDSPEGKEARSKLPFDFELGAFLTEVGHTLTHRQLQMQVYLASSLLTSSPQAAPEGYRWLDPSQREVAVPVAHQKILSYLNAHPLLLSLYSA